MSELLYIDVETVRCQDVNARQQIIADAKLGLKASGACKTEASRLKSLQKKLDEFDGDEVVNKTVFDGDYGELITIGYAFENDPIEALQRDGYIDEFSILQGFFDNIAEYADSVNVPSKLFKPLWVAHNKSFDLSFIYKRCVILNIDTYGVKIPINEKYNSKNSYCTMAAWMGYGAIAGGTLDRIAGLYGIEGKGDFCGADVNDAWENGEFNKIQEYCKTDVELLRKIYKRQNFLK